MKRKRKSNPQLPTGRMIHCEGVVLDSKGRVKKMKIRQNELKKLKRSNPFGGYATRKEQLAARRKTARLQKKRYAAAMKSKTRKTKNRKRR